MTFDGPISLKELRSYCAMAQSVEKQVAAEKQAKEPGECMIETRKFTERRLDSLRMMLKKAEFNLVRDEWERDSILEKIRECEKELQIELGHPSTIRPEDLL